MEVEINPFFFIETLSAKETESPAVFGEIFLNDFLLHNRGSSQLLCFYFYGNQAVLWIDRLRVDSVEIRQYSEGQRVIQSESIFLSFKTWCIELIIHKWIHIFENHCYISHNHTTKDDQNRIQAFILWIGSYSQKKSHFVLLSLVMHTSHPHTLFSHSKEQRSAEIPSISPFLSFTN